MPIICRDYDLLFTHVPKTGGTFVQRVLTDQLGGEMLSPKHMSYRRSSLADPPSIRVFTVRDPVDWYRSYWAYARSSVEHRAAWPTWQGGDVTHPTQPLDDRCGHRSFAWFVRNSLREFPEGFLRSVYCDFLNGATHALRAEHLREDLERLLELVGHEDPAVVRSLNDVGVTRRFWRQQAVLSPTLESRLREVENLDGLDFPYIGEVAGELARDGTMAVSDGAASRPAVDQALASR
jgi:hypothetical protein